jgi:hypothetical protein
MMAADKIRSTAVKIGIRPDPSQRFGFHNFRHSLATFLINKGKDLKTIQELLRHAKASTTLDLYSQAIDASSWRLRRIWLLQSPAVSSKPIRKRLWQRKVGKTTLHTLRPSVANRRRPYRLHGQYYAL